MSAQLIGSVSALNQNHSGAGKIIESVTSLGQPVRRKVRLCDERNAQVLAEKFSDGGIVTFEYLRTDYPYLLYALDHAGEYEAVIIANRYATMTGARPE